MMFSFVIPAYNEEGYLGRCIGSIKKQRTKDYEIIVCYSASKDRTLDIAKKSGARIVNVRKSSPGIAKNAGAMVAKGSYLVFLDADAAIPADFLSSTRKILNNGVVAVGYSFRSLEPDRVINAAHRLFLNPLFSGMGWFYGCYAVEKNAFEKAGGFDKNRAVNEDIDLASKLKSIGRIVYANNVVVSVSSRRAKKMGKVRTVAMYVSWLFLGYVIGKKIKFRHVSEL